MTTEHLDALAEIVRKMTPGVWEIMSWLVEGIGSHAIVSKEAESIIVDDPPPDRAEPTNDLRGIVTLKNAADALIASARAGLELRQACAGATDPNYMRDKIEYKIKVAIAAFDHATAAPRETPDANA